MRDAILEARVGDGPLKRRERGPEHLVTVVVDRDRRPRVDQRYRFDAPARVHRQEDPEDLRSAEVEQRQIDLRGASGDLLEVGVIGRVCRQLEGG
ncbi:MULTISPECIES: hypothetical protein [Natrialbaceae]|uniref:hypothetical protein n=1 Tax=Natrialbaceae TaxID=1644061 RepID=UPI00207D4938|nr:hypothetical protein [Natronococcus sp. CG52]